MAASFGSFHGSKGTFITGYHGSNGRFATGFIGSNGRVVFLVPMMTLQAFLVAALPAAMAALWVASCSSGTAAFLVAMASLLAFLVAPLSAAVVALWAASFSNGCCITGGFLGSNIFVTSFLGMVGLLWAAASFTNGKQWQVAV
jgi:hypothetical protein